MDYYHSRGRFIKDQIDNLAGIIALIDGIIDDQLLKLLKVIKDQRNFIAHGKREAKYPAFEYPLDTIAGTLDEVIMEIEK